VSPKSGSGSSPSSDENKENIHQSAADSADSGGKSAEMTPMEVEVATSSATVSETRQMTSEVEMVSDVDCSISEND
jgi:hypothetical protein